VHLLTELAQQFIFIKVCIKFIYDPICTDCYAYIKVLNHCILECFVFVI